MGKEEEGGEVWDATTTWRTPTQEEQSTCAQGQPRRNTYLGTWITCKYSAQASTFSPERVFSQAAWIFGRLGMID
ncbi:hypothetical protein NQZ68_013734 [Dissostichus eleginoides]|nr:hypothetical protein NQZ68_013734 [Dissostichus eleginoides]